MTVLSFMEIDGVEIANSARLSAFQAAGLLPSEFELTGQPCGVLVREASGAASSCADFGFSDDMPTTQLLGPLSIPSYISGMGLNQFSRIAPQVPIGTPSDGYAVANDGPNGVYAWSPTQGGAWLDGIVGVAWDPLTLAGGAVGAYGRAHGPVTVANQSTPAAAFPIVGDYWLGAEVNFGAGLTQLRLRAYSRLGQNPALSNLGVTLGTPITLANVPGRQWIVLRLAGANVVAEWWTQDPRLAGGQPYASIPYTLTGALIGPGVTELAAFGVAGVQGVAIGGSGPLVNTTPAHAVPYWWSEPSCARGCNLYPSPFLAPSSTLAPGSCTGSVLSTTPWTDSSRPESSDFRGFYIDEMDGLDGDAFRSVDQRVGGLGGAALGPVIQEGRKITVHGWLVASSCRGLDYGREWLLNALASTCNPCPDAVMRLRTTVPVPDDGTADQQGLYLLYDVGLTDGPVITPYGLDCALSEVAFELTTGNGFKYQGIQSLLAATTLASSNGSVSAQIPSPPGIGTNGAIVTIRAGSSDLLGVYPAVQLATYPADNLWPSNCTYPNDGGSPVTLPITTCPTGFLIPRIPAGGTLIIDSAKHTITFVDAFGTVSDGTYLLSQDTARAIDWLEAEACDQGHGDVVRVGATTYAPDASVQIDYQHRER